VLIALTGWGQEDDRRRSREAGFDHHLVKPADPEAVQEFLARPTLVGQAAVQTRIESVCSESGSP
jgi:CheY-like chemotaxis protein